MPAHVAFASSTAILTAIIPIAVPLLLSSHLETGHYFNPHAQRIMEAKQNGAKLVSIDLRLSNTASHADLWISPWPGSEAAIFLSVASYLLRTRKIDKDYIRRWVNWDVYLERLHPDDLPGVWDVVRLRASSSCRLGSPSGKANADRAAPRKVGRRKRPPRAVG